MIHDCALQLKQMAEAIRKCERCALAKTRTNAVPGEGPHSARLMFVGEAPGAVNDRLGRPFVGHGGRIFDQILEQCGIDRSQVFVTNAVKCWPPGNRPPGNRELELCHPYLEEQVRLISPICIFTLGGKAFTQLTGRSNKVRDDHGELLRLRDIIICPTFHPNGLRYIRGGMQTIVSDIRHALSQMSLDARRQPLQQLLDL